MSRFIIKHARVRGLKSFRNVSYFFIVWYFDGIKVVCDSCLVGPQGIFDDDGKMVVVDGDTLSWL